MSKRKVTSKPRAGKKAATKRAAKRLQPMDEIVITRRTLAMIARELRDCHRRMGEALTNLGHVTEVVRAFADREVTS